MLLYKKGFNFKSVIYNQPVDNKFTLSYGKTPYGLANSLLALVRGTEAKSKADWSSRKFSPFPMALISLIDHASEVSEPFQGRRLTQSPAASWAF